MAQDEQRRTHSGVAAGSGSVGNNPPQSSVSPSSSEIYDADSFFCWVLTVGPVMDEVTLCEPFELYNLLNQSRCVSRLAEVNYLCLVDARERPDYYTSHIITARSMKMDSSGRFLLPEAVEVDSMQHVVVYDNDTSSLQKQGRAVDCARVLAEVSLCPVRVVRGGFQRFSALYLFLRTEKILYTITELENLKIYPVEVIPGLLFMGDQKQSMDTSILNLLKIRAVVNISDAVLDNSLPVNGNPTVLNICASNSLDSDLYSSFQNICTFIDSHVSLGSRVLVVSSRGRNRCSAVAVSFLMHHFKYTLEEAWRFLLECKPSVSLNRGVLQQLSDWEVRSTEGKRTDPTTFHL